MTDINTHITAAKGFLVQKKLNHALDEIMVVLELLAAKKEIEPTPEPKKEVEAKTPPVKKTKTKDATTPKKPVGTRSTDVAATPGSIVV